MSPVFRIASVAFAPLVGWVARHPVRTAGAVAAALATWVVLASLGAVSLAGATTDGLTLARVGTFAANRPAYPAAAVVGLATFLFAR